MVEYQIGAQRFGRSFELSSPHAGHVDLYTRDTATGKVIEPQDHSRAITYSGFEVERSR